MFFPLTYPNTMKNTEQESLTSLVVLLPNFMYTVMTKWSLHYVNLSSHTTAYKTEDLTQMIGRPTLYLMSDQRQYNPLGQGRAVCLDCVSEAFKFSSAQAWFLCVTPVPLTCLSSGGDLRAVVSSGFEPSLPLLSPALSPLTCFFL